MIATASASAASGPAIFTPGSSRDDHRVDLRLLGAAGADHRLLDEPRRIFADVDPGASGGHEDDAARLAELERRLRVLVGEDLLDRRGAGRMLLDHGLELLGERGKPARQRRSGVGPDLAVGDVREAIAVSLDQAPAGGAEAGIEAEDLQASRSSSSSGTS